MKEKSIIVKLSDLHKEVKVKTKEDLVQRLKIAEAKLRKIEYPGQPEIFIEDEMPDNIYTITESIKYFGTFTRNDKFEYVIFYSEMLPDYSTFNGEVVRIPDYISNIDFFTSCGLDVTKRWTIERELPAARIRDITLDTSLSNVHKFFWTQKGTADILYEYEQTIDFLEIK